MTAEAPINVPAFRKSLRVEHVPGQGAFFFFDCGQLVLTGTAAEAVTGLIDGRRSADDIARTLADRVRPEDVYYTLAMMGQSRLVYDAVDEAEGSDHLTLWNWLGADLKRARQRLRNTTVTAAGASGLDVKPFVDALRVFDLNTAPDGEFTLVVTGDYLHSELADFNRKALEGNRPWMLVRPTGATTLFGPVFRPGVTACWECLAHRMRAGRALETYFNASGRSISLARPELPADMSHAAHLAALHAARWVVFGESPQLEGRIVTFDPSTFVTQTHIVTRRPQCPACGVALDPARLAQRPLLDNRPRTFSIDSGHRTSSAEVTFAEYHHHVSPLTGIVSGLSPMQTQGAELVKLYVAGHNFPLDSTSLNFLRQSMETQSCGKGATEAQARTGALLEALERYSGVYQGDEPRIRATWGELGERAIHPNRCMLFSDAQFENRDEWNRVGCSFSLVPNRFDENEEIDWTPVWSFGAQDFRYLPTSYLYYGYPQNPETAGCWADSNGNAAGSSLEEALLHGFFELVERDAVAMWWYNRVNRPAVDLESFGDPYIRRCIDTYSRNGRQMWVLDVTSDLGIPVFAAVSRRFDSPVEDIIMGFGAHLDARVALTRAVTEMNQFLPAVSGPLDAQGKRQYAYSEAAAIRWWQSATVSDQPYLLPDRALPLRPASGYPTLASDDHLVDIMRCISKAHERGIDTLLLDQTRPDVGVSAAKVIAPGMRHFWARLGPGRLYDVPVELGWLPRARREEELNPIPMFL